MSEICPYCGSTANVKDSSLIYGKSYGEALICDNFPVCDSYTTVYREGRYMADKELRELRKKCHNDCFDPLWKSGLHKRKWLYELLQRLLHVSKEQAHFGKLSKEQCLTVIQAIQTNQFIIIESGVANKAC